MPEHVFYHIGVEIPITPKDCCPGQNQANLGCQNDFRKQP